MNVVFMILGFIIGWYGFAVDSQTAYNVSATLFIASMFLTVVSIFED